MIKSTAWILLFLTPLLFGCAQKPRKAFEENVDPLETAVFIARDNSCCEFYVLTAIGEVDGVRYSGGDMWVRVLPGDHSFLMRILSDFSLGGGYASHSEVVVPIEVRDMKAGHVYIARYSFDGSGVRIDVEDAGYSPDFRLKVGARSFPAFTN